MFENDDVCLFYILANFPLVVQTQIKSLKFMDLIALDCCLSVLFVK